MGAIEISREGHVIIQKLQTNHPVLILFQQLGSAVSEGGRCEGVKGAILFASALVRQGWTLATSDSALPVSLILHTFSQCLDECLTFLSQLSIQPKLSESSESSLLLPVAVNSLHASLAHFTDTSLSLSHLANLGKDFLSLSPSSRVTFV
jgi:hypothetical protein